METKTLLRLIKDDISHLQGITDDFDSGSLPSSDEVELALVRAKAMVRQLELLHKRTEDFEHDLKYLNTADQPKFEMVEFSLPEQEQIVQADSERENSTLIPTPENEESVTDIVVTTEPEPAILKSEIPLSVSDQKEELPLQGDELSKQSEGAIPGESQQLVNEIFSQEKSESGYQIIPISNIWDGIGINDRILFIRELFENNSTKFEEAVSALNHLDTIQDAVNFLKLNFKWHKTEASQKFLVLVKRRFTK